jgi:hypothetical protein
MRRKNSFLFEFRLKFDGLFCKERLNDAVKSFTKWLFGGPGKQHRFSQDEKPD